MKEYRSATDELADELEHDLAANSGAIAIICCLDEMNAEECARWLEWHRARLLVADHDFTRGDIHFPAGRYRLLKGAVSYWGKMARR